MNHPATQARSPELARIVSWFEGLSRTTLTSIGEVYAEHAHFKDPFNDVRGCENIGAIYAHMFENLSDPRFEITQTIEQGDQAFVAWRFLFHWRGQSFDIPGGTQMTLNDQGLITDHMDYWDVAAGLYEKLPLLGGLLKMLRKRMAAVSPTRP